MKTILLLLLLLAPLKGAVTQLAWDAYPTAQYFWVWDVSTTPRTMLTSPTGPAATIDVPPGTRVAVSACVSTPAGNVESAMSRPVTTPISTRLTIQISADLSTWNIERSVVMDVGDPRIEPREDGPWLVDSRGPIFLIEPRPAQTRFYRLKLESP